jgi:hypothetical protein
MHIQNPRAAGIFASQGGKSELRWRRPVPFAGAHGRKSISFLSGESKESAFHVKLYRFMADSIPLINSVLWTWSRLAAAPGEFRILRKEKPIIGHEAVEVIDALFRRVCKSNFGHTGSHDDLLPPFFHSLFMDGAVVGKLELEADLSGISTFRFFDLSRCEVALSPTGEVTLRVSSETGEQVFRGQDLFYYALNADLANPHGRSVLKAIPFVSYVEQQLVDDMRKTTHNAGYHRLHVKIKPPERREGESDETYVDRANGYFDSSVAMIRDIEPDDNPVTWDDVAIEYIGPPGSGGVKTGNWYLSHRAMIEEICSGTHLAPFLLGYSYNATTNWAQFKYDLVMRQVRSVQNGAIAFLDWLANIELALKGFDLRGSWQFDNNFSALAGEQEEIKSKQAAYIIDLFKAGLIDKEAASARASRLV